MKKNYPEIRWLKPTTVLLYHDFAGQDFEWIQLVLTWLCVALAPLSGIHMVGGLLWGSQDGFLCMPGTILERAGRPGSARAGEQQASACHLQHVSVREAELLTGKLAFPRASIPMAHAGAARLRVA